ncbi:MAG: NAD-dependent epimerase/dehydratase family protein [Flavobacteriales bacterium]|nr:NAD-dependent epimerase/dehydratase family protein [Flavobacteriales bacterium]
MDLITGATGIVGTHLLLERARSGGPVRALFRRGSDRSIVQQVFDHYDASELVPRIEWVEGDLLDVSSLTDAIQGVAHVYHTAALVSFDPRMAKAMYAVNVQGTANLVNVALECGVKRLCHVSSTAAIGRATVGVDRTEDLPWIDDKNTSDYARSKYMAELEVQRGILEGLDAVMVNPCVIIGPGAGTRSSMALVDRVQRGTRFFTTGSNAFVDARDVAKCMSLLMERGISGERYLLVGENADYRRLFDLLCDGFGSPRPTREAKSWMLGLAWRLEAVRSRLMGRSPLVTRATVESSMNRRGYSNAKVTALLGHHFISLEGSVANVVSFAKRRVSR